MVDGRMKLVVMVMKLMRLLIESWRSMKRRLLLIWMLKGVLMNGTRWKAGRDRDVHKESVAWDWRKGGYARREIGRR
jgi:hypothetical protein